MKPPQEVIEELLAAGAKQAIVQQTSEAEVRFACNAFTTNGVRTTRRVTVVSGGIVSRAGNVEAREIIAAARAAGEDEGELVEGDEDGDFGEPPGRTGLAVLAPVRPTFERGEVAGFAEHHVETVYFGNATGLRRRHCQTTTAVQLVSRRGGHSAWAGTTEIELPSITTLDLPKRELQAGDYEVILPPAAVADLMVPLLEAASGRETDEGRTVFSKNPHVSDQPFRLRSDPHEEGLKCLPFACATASSVDVSVHDNGRDLEPVAWIENGELANLRYPHRTLPVDNLILELPSASTNLEEMVANTERGLLLTCLWYIREVDPAQLLLTGLTRDGVYVIKDGAIVATASNFRFNESPASLLQRATEVGRSERTLGREFGEWMNRTKMPPLRIPDFHMSSVSQAT